MPTASAVLDQRARDLRKTIVRAMGAGGRGHFGSAFSILEILRVLYDDVLRFDATQPKWPGRDRFILSKGHGCLALYAVLADKGFFPAEELFKFCQKDGLLGGHPEIRIPGVEASTGSLGHGLSIGIGFALNARLDRAPSRTFVVIGDGESNEGAIWEAALCACKHRLESLTAIVDSNKQQSYGPTAEVLNLEPLRDKWESFGWAVAEVDGHDVDALRGVFARLPLAPGRPSVIIAHTVKGKGIAFTEHNMHWHHKAKIAAGEIESLLAALETAP